MPDEPSWPTVDDDDAAHEPPTVQVNRPRAVESPTMRIPLPPPSGRSGEGGSEPFTDRGGPSAGTGGEGAAEPARRSRPSPPEAGSAETAVFARPGPGTSGPPRDDRTRPLDQGAEGGRGAPARTGSPRQGHPPAGPSTAGLGTAGLGTAGPDRGGLDRAGHDGAGRTGAGRDAAAHGGAGRNGAGTGRENAARENGNPNSGGEEHSRPQRIPPADGGGPSDPGDRSDGTGGERRKRPLVLIGALALVVVLAAGAVTSWQLGWFDTAPVRTTAAPQPPAAVSLAVRGVGADAPAPSAAGVASALRAPAGNPVLGTLTGSVVDPATGQALWKQGDTTPLTPASTIKILVSAAALLALDHTSQLSTKVVQGEQPGTVVLVGGGDPTLSTFPADRATVYPGAPTLDDLASQVSANGPVTQVLFDVSRYKGDGMAPGWEPGDVPGGYVAPIVPLMVDGGRQNPTLYDTPRSATPAATAASALAARLGVTSVAPGTAPAGAKVLGEVKSVPVDQLVENLMQISDNVLAETMAREVALAKGMEPTFAGGVQAVRAVLTENGFDLTGTEIFDASGLSKDDKVPARLLSDILSAAAKPDASDPRTAKLRPLLTALPVAGGSGTLAGRYATAGAAGRGWVRAKTGTLTGVNSLAGAVVDVDGRLLVFSFMSLSGEHPDKVRGALDELAAALRGCGCG